MTTRRVLFVQVPEAMRFPFSLANRLKSYRNYTCYKSLKSSIDMSSDRRYSSNGLKNFNGYLKEKTPFLIGVAGGTIKIACS